MCLKILNLKLLLDHGMKNYRCPCSTEHCNKRAQCQHVAYNNNYVAEECNLYRKIKCFRLVNNKILR